MENIQVIKGNINNEKHAAHMLQLLDQYMQDPMGGKWSMPSQLANDIVAGLKKQANYVFFIAYCNNQPAGIANCFINFSTFKAKQLINIHDFAVSQHFRRRGIGEALMQGIVDDARQQGYCKITLEVRHDNHGAQNLYKKAGFTECDVPMYFWELVL
ncbi:MAG: GNAT family N-acetyltransferase [Prolixibacteraceae bacterium]|jgi:GNAT superfamily N-acetyltransferase|nr:GNAT family N-acetyltransferase [Prolixibacteraceae bacterium]